MPRVLTIEDDAVTGQEIVAELTSHGLEVEWADNGREGLAKAIAGGYDLITLDRMLPEVDGLTIVTTLRSLKIATPCAETGICTDCHAPQRICRITTILHRRPMRTPVSVLLINDALGF